MSTPRSHVKRALAPALSTAPAPSSATKPTSATKSAPLASSTAARLARCYPPDPTVYQSAVRSFYHNYREVVALWRQCNLSCTAAVQSVSNGCLQLIEGAGQDWGVFAQQPAVRQAVEREARKQIRKAQEEAEDCMSELLDSYSALHDSTRALQSRHDEWLNTAASIAAAGAELSEEQADEWLGCPLFERGNCAMSEFVAMADELLAMHRKELALKRTMLQHVASIAAQQTGANASAAGGVSELRVVLEQYMSCWTLEPFLHAERIEEIARIWQTECPAVATGAAS